MGIHPLSKLFTEISRLVDYSDLSPGYMEAKSELENYIILKDKQLSDLKGELAECNRKLAEAYYALDGSPNRTYCQCAKYPDEAMLCGVCKARKILRSQEGDSDGE